MGNQYNFVEDILKEDSGITWTRLSTLIAERYANLNRQKEVSDRQHALRFADFETPREDPTSTLERIVGYISKYAPIDLPIDRSDTAKARFLSNATSEQMWALHAKARISATATYERTVQALATSIHGMAEHEKGRVLSRTRRTELQHRRQLYKTNAQSHTHNNDECLEYLTRHVKMMYISRFSF